MQDNEHIILGTTNFRGAHKRFGIKAADRARHFYLLGQTGVGKSTLIQNMVLQDVAHGNGLCLLDPHSETANSVLDQLPASVADSVLYINPLDEYPVSLNALQTGNAAMQELAASHVVSIFTSIWGSAFMARSQDLIRNSVLALMGIEGASLLWIPRLLTDHTFRNSEILPRVRNPIVKDYWEKEYNLYTKSFRNEATAPVLNKLRSFLSFTSMRGVVAQPYRKVSLETVMDEGLIMICALPKGLLGEENASLLMSLISAEIYLASLARTAIPEHERRPFYVYIDEVQSITGSILVPMLSEIRKYRTALILAHQYTAQLSEPTRQAIFGNVGSILSFRLGAEDSYLLSREFSKAIEPQDLERLPVHHAYVRLSVDGATSAPFSMMTLPPTPATHKSNREKIINASRQRYGRKRDFVEERTAQWMENPTVSKHANPSTPPPKNKHASRYTVFQDEA